MQQSTFDVKTITPEMLGTLLLNIFRPETEVINQSTAILKKYFELPTSLGPLLAHMTSHSDMRVRLLASICLKKKLTTHWSAQEASFKDSIKTTLSNAYLAETTLKVKENVAYAIGALASLLIPSNEWPELFAFIMAKCQSTNTTDIEHGALLLNAVCEALGNAIEPFLGPVAEILNKLITLQHVAVQTLVVKTINAITMSNLTTDSLIKISGLLPQMVQVVMRLESNESLLHEVFDNLSELVDLPKFLVPHLSALIAAALSVATNKSHNNELRKVAMMFVQSTVITKSKIIKKDKATVVKVLEAAFTISRESEEGYEEDEETPVDAALDMLEQYAFKIPNTMIYPLLMQGCEAFLKSPDPQSRRAALLILGTVSKGIEDPIKNNLEAVLNVVLQCIADPSAEVQEACVIALCYFADNLSPDLMDYHAKVLPPLLDAVGSKTEKVRTRVFYALETFCENLSEKEIVPYLKPLLQSLVVYLDNPDIEIKRNAVMALTSVITAAKKEVGPYFETLMTKLSAFLMGAESKDEMLRAKATIAIGRLAFAVGKEKYQPYLETISQKVLADLQKWELFEMSEAAYSYFGEISKLLGPEFAPMLPTLVPIAIKSCISDEGIKKEYKETKKDDFSLGSDSEEEDDNLKGITVRTAFLDEKTAALHALGLFSVSCPKAFLPHMQTCIQMLETIWNYFNETIRYQVAQTYQQFVESLNLAHYGTESHPKPVMGLPAKVKLAPDAHKLYYDLILPRYLHQIKTDEDREVVAKVLEAIADLCTCIGPAVVEDKLGALLEGLLMLLNRKAPCQNEEDEDEDEDEEGSEDDDVDHDEMLTGNLLDLIQNIAKVCGESVTPHFKPIFAALTKYLKPSRPENDWMMGIGCFAELLKELPSTIPEYGPKILPLCFNYCTSGNNDLTRNAAYCIGVIAETSKAFAAPYINEMLQALKNAYDMPKAQEPKDNAISSILRLLVAFPDKVPLELVLPAVFINIPLNGDVIENTNVAKSLAMLAPDYYKTNAKYTENALMTCVRVIVDSECEAEDEVKTLVGKHLAKMGTMPEAETMLRGLIGKMSSEEVNQLQKFVV